MNSCEERVSKREYNINKPTNIYNICVHVRTVFHYIYQVPYLSYLIFYKFYVTVYRRFLLRNPTKILAYLSPILAYSAYTSTGKTQFNKLNYKIYINLLFDKHFIHFLKKRISALQTRKSYGNTVFLFILTGMHTM